MTEDMQVVAFKLGNEEYAVDILAVQEIIRWSDITRVPKAPFYVKGVLNLRGSIIPVVDSRQRFNLPAQEITDTTRIIILRLGDSPIGMTVDNVTEVVRLGSEQIERPQEVNGVNNQFIKGIGKCGERLILLLDLEEVLDLAV